LISFTAGFAGSGVTPSAGPAPQQCPGFDGIDFFPHSTGILTTATSSFLKPLFVRQ
jgi:hypothetical protein